MLAGTCFREELTAGCFTMGRVGRSNVAEGFLQLAVGALQPPAPSLMGTRAEGEGKPEEKDGCEG